MAYSPPPPPTKIISFQQIVNENDRSWTQDKVRPWIYEMSNGRLFYWRQDVYTTAGP